jgi:hypothetical protein
MAETPKRNIKDNIDVVNDCPTQTGTAKKSITFKRVDIDVKLNGVPLDKETAPFPSSY